MGGGGGVRDEREGEGRGGRRGGGGEAICYLICSRLKSQTEDFHPLRSLFLLLFLLSLFMCLFFPLTAGTHSTLAFSSSSAHCLTQC